MNKLLLLFAMMTISIFGEAQVNRYAVFFKDKTGDGYPYSLDNPSGFLSARSIQRREKQNISLNDSDLPVNPAYVSSLNDLGHRVYFTSKWVNAALLQVDQSVIESISALSFVDSVTIVAEGAKLLDTENNVNVPTSFDNVVRVAANFRRTDISSGEGIC